MKLRPVIQSDAESVGTGSCTRSGLRDVSLSVLERFIDDDDELLKIQYVFCFFVFYIYRKRASGCISIFCNIIIHENYFSIYYYYQLGTKKY